MSAITHNTGTYADVNGVKMYYEEHGSGKPLILIHGGISSIESSFASILPQLANIRRVYAIELQGHGRTADIDRPFSYENFAADVTAFIEHLALDKPDILGYSMGAGTALRLAMSNKDSVGKLILAAVSYDDAGMYPQAKAMAGMATPEMMEGTPFQIDYAKLAPNPQDWPQLLHKIGVLDKGEQHWSADEIKALNIPTLLIAGDSDIIMPEHTVELFRLLGGGVPGDIEGLPASRLAILPATTHIGLMEHPAVPDMVVSFLQSEPESVASDGSN